MVAYYRALGVVVLLGLAVTAALLWTIVAWLGERQGLALTLAGATGIIVSIGVTIDSYVVYFERLKDEVRSGKTLRSSAERGFSAAYRTILAGNLASLIGATVLYLLTVGAVRGFAFFLAVSTFLDIVVAWFFTRPLVTLLSRRMRGGRVLGVSSGEALPAARERTPVGAST
jgi:preprotein translocase subunit SecD